MLEASLWGAGSLLLEGDPGHLLLTWCPALPRALPDAHTAPQEGGDPLAHRDHPLQADVEVFPLVSLQLLEREPGLTNELIVAKLVLVTHGDPATGQRESNRH